MENCICIFITDHTSGDIFSDYEFDLGTFEMSKPRNYAQP